MACSFMCWHPQEPCQVNLPDWPIDAYADSIELVQTTEYGMCSCRYAYVSVGMHRLLNLAFALHCISQD